MRSRIEVERQEVVGVCLHEAQIMFERGATMVLAKGRSSDGRPCREVLIKTTVEDLPTDPAPERAAPPHFS